MTLLYLDWNIFDKLEKLADLPTGERASYDQLENLILQGVVTVPYSNAHINDLFRGYSKNPSFTPGHLTNISRLTNQLCLTQYWNEKTTRWHYRDPAGFLEQIASEHPSTDYRTLLYREDVPESKILWDQHCALLESIPLPAKFKEIYKTDPIFLSIYPRSHSSMNMLALSEDILTFSTAIKTDFVLYKNFRKYLTTLQQKLPQLAKTIQALQKQNTTSAPLTWDQTWDAAQPTFQPSSNLEYDKIFSLFTTTDLKGYRQDERFANLIDDALHTFYGAHCAYFLTLDQRCTDKAKKVYEKLKIPTKVMDVPQFVADFNHLTCDD